MEYDTIASMFLIPTGEESAPPTVPNTAARQLRDAVEPIATIGWWSRAAAESVTALGHDFFDGYVWGRAASLGADVAPSVVVSAFGVFSGALLGPVYQHGRSVSSRDAILAAREVGATAGLRAATASVDATLIDDTGARLMAVIGAIEPGPRHLFGALQALTVPTDPYGRLWRAAELVREHRGDGHLAACAAHGLDMAEMNVLTEVWLDYPIGAYSSTRGYDADSTAAAADRLAKRGWMRDGALTPTGRSARNAIEDATDRSQEQLIAALGPDVALLTAQLQVIASTVIAAHAAPADPRKRAAG